MNDQEFIDALPATGEISYEDFLNQQRALGKERFVKMRLHPLRRNGRIGTRVEIPEDGSPPILHLSRPTGA